MMLEEEAKEDRKRREEELAREYADEVMNADAQPLYSQSRNPFG